MVLNNYWIISSGSISKLFPSLSFDYDLTPQQLSIHATAQFIFVNRSLWISSSVILNGVKSFLNFLHFGTFISITLQGGGNKGLLGLCSKSRAV